MANPAAPVINALPTIASIMSAAKMPVKAIAEDADNLKPTSPTANATILPTEPIPMGIATLVLVAQTTSQPHREKSAKADPATIQAQPVALPTSAAMPTASPPVPLT